MIEGPIGAGKTEMIKILVPALAQKFGRVQLIKEPIDRWLEVGAFQKYCADKHLAYEFQTLAFSTRVQEAIEAFEADPDAPCRISERSMEADQIFMEILKKDGYVQDYQWKMYQTWCHTWKRMWPWKPTHYILATTPLEVLQSRVEQRNRPGEKKAITEKFQQDLIDEYDVHFGPDFSVPVLRLDTTQNYIEDPSARKDLIEKVYEFLINN